LIRQHTFIITILLNTTKAVTVITIESPYRTPGDCCGRSN